jgi:putative membrane protein
MLGKTLITSSIAIALSTLAAYQNPAVAQFAQISQSSQQITVLDQEFAAEAAENAIAAIQLGQMAVQQGTNEDVKSYAQQMVRDQTKIYNQIKQLASRKGIAIPEGMGNTNRLEMENLSRFSGTEFDRAYMRQMLEDRTRDESLYGRVALQGDDPDLKAWAKKNLSSVKQQFRSARSIARDLRQPAPPPEAAPVAQPPNTP